MKVTGASTQQAPGGDAARAEFGLGPSTPASSVLPRANTSPFGQRQPPCGSGKQAHAESRLQVPDVARDGPPGKSERIGRADETAGIDLTALKVRISRNRSIVSPGLNSSYQKSPFT